MKRLVGWMARRCAPSSTAPLGTTTFAPRRASCTFPGVTPFASSHAGRSSTWISRSRPPITSAAATPSTRPR
ncbi:MAG: hypothetical protein M5U28_20140 [Sandaracinaceae bacterium]|nr:hypothetical protein [Sandaracinaceae bacterium]